MSVTDVLGWAGALGILVAYGLLTIGRWASESLRYQGANAVFAAALLVWAVSIQAWQSLCSTRCGRWSASSGWPVGLRHVPGGPPPHLGD